MTDLHVVVPFAPRAWQRSILECTAPRMVGVVHRRAGKTECFMWRGLRKAATWKRQHVPAHRRNLDGAPPRVVHVLPMRVQWTRTGMWDRLERAASCIPGAEVLKSELQVRLPNGRVYQAGGMDNPEGWRGGYADEVIEDEADDVAAGGLNMVIDPMLADYQGTRVYAGTPKGTGRLADLYDKAQGEGWARWRLGYQDTGCVGAIERDKDPDGFDRAIAKLRADLTAEEFAQELECSFEAPNSGSYYGSLLDQAEREGRVTNVPWEPRLPVFTGWDLGMDDATAIWFLQLLPGSGEVRAIDYLEASGEGLDYYARQLAGRGYVYGLHHLPHDVAVREMGTGRSRKEMLETLGVRPIKAGRALPVADGINATRMLLPRMWFDAAKTETGRKRLRGYRRQWIEERSVWSAQPYHDGSSHGADALREFAINYRDPVSPAEIERRAGVRRALEQGGRGFDPLSW